MRPGPDDACRRPRFEVLHDSVYEVAQRSLRGTRVRREARNRSSHYGRWIYLGHKESRTGSRHRSNTWNLCLEKLRSGDYDLLVFDELVYVLSYQMLPLEEVLEEFRGVRASQPALHIVVTGRDAPAELIEAADLVTEMREIKHPFNAGIRAQQGIEF